MGRWRRLDHIASARHMYVCKSTNTYVYAFKSVTVPDDGQLLRE